MTPPGFNASRFWRHVQKDPQGCWIWTKRPDSSGYGCFRVGPKVWYVHVLSYLSEVGTIPDGWFVDHTCRNRLCVNPKHLEAVTPRENTLRGSGPTAANARKTHCDRGHEFTDDNIIWKDGRRNCLACRKASRETLKKKVKSTARRPKPASGTLQKYRDAGMSWREIGLEYGVSDTAARKWGRQMGVR